MRKKQNSNHEFLYKEIQQIRQWYIWLMLFLFLFLDIFFIIDQFSSQIREYENNTLEIAGGTLIIFILLVIMITVGSSKLITKIDENAIYFQWFPIQTKHKIIPFKAVNRAVLMTYKNIGLGIKESKDFGTIYNAMGNKGLYLDTIKGKFLLGTANPEALDKILLELKDRHDIQYIYENRIDT